MEEMPKQILLRVILVCLLCAKGSTGQPVVCFDTYTCCKIGNCTNMQYFDVASNKCLACPSDTYLHADGHACSNCLSCSSVKIRIEECPSPCGKGFFAQGGSSVHDPLYCVQCSKCSEDEHEVTSCGQDRDTVCAKTTQDSVPPTMTTAHPEHNGKAVSPITEGKAISNKDMQTTTLLLFVLVMYFLLFN